MTVAPEVVEYVEKLCEYIENIDNGIIEHLSLLGRRVSVPASVAAARVYFYIENKTMIHERKKLLYDQFYFIMTDEKCKWETLTTDEKVSLIVKLEIFSIFVFV